MKSRCLSVILALLSALSAAPAAAQDAPDNALVAKPKGTSDSTWNPQFHPAVQEDEFLRQGAAFANTPDGRIVRFSAKTTSISSDHGQTWSAPRPVPLGEHTGSAPQLAVTANGVFVLAYMNSAESVWEWDYKTREVSADSTLPVYATRTDDEGKTWSEPRCRTLP